MKFNDTQTSYSNEQSSYINYSGFNPFPSPGHLNREKDDGSESSTQRSMSKCWHRLWWETVQMELGVHG